MKHFNIRISGRVQGVFFRASAKAQADRLGVTGVVRNEPDGSVYIEAEGEEENLKTFIDWCRKGPAGARVTACTAQEGPPARHAGFEIVR